MGIFDKLFKVNKERLGSLKLSSDEAFIGIMFSAVMADEVITREEMNNLMFIFSKFKGLGRLTAVQFEQIMNRFHQIVRREGVGTMIAAAKNHLDNELRETAFANAVDLVLADGILDEREKEFLEKFQEAVGISDELAQKITEVAIIKNRGTTADIFASSDPSRMFS